VAIFAFRKAASRVPEVTRGDRRRARRRADEVIE